jgi:hypothetical protein
MTIPTFSRLLILTFYLFNLASFLCTGIAAQSIVTDTLVTVACWLGVYLLEKLHKRISRS